MQIKFNKKFDKSYKKLDNKIKIKFKEKLSIFYYNTTDIILKNHSLNGKYLGYKSINITGDLRAIFKEYPNGTYEFVEFYEIGTHSQLY